MQRSWVHAAESVTRGALIRVSLPMTTAAQAVPKIMIQSWYVLPVRRKILDVNILPCGSAKTRSVSHLFC